jgi:16S rRNA (cytidine1402-2'-O)-methyltransferase
MKRQKSFQNDVVSLYLVTTPIGNLDEFSNRCVDILKSVSVIAAEDTRTTQKLLNHFGINTKCIAHHMHNEKNSADGIIKLLNSGQSVALVSDAGLPLISDPGLILVQTALQEGFNVIPVGINNAGLAALIASGLKTQPYTFVGFLPTQDKAFRLECEQYKSYATTLIIYEAPHRMKKTLQKLETIFGNRQAVLARELTKLHEEFIRGNISELIEVVDELKGEMVLIIEGHETDREADIDLSEINALIQNRINQGLSASDAIKEISQLTGLSKNEIYSHYHQKEPS